MIISATTDKGNGAASATEELVWEGVFVSLIVPDELGVGEIVAD